MKRLRPLSPLLEARPTATKRRATRSPVAGRVVAGLILFTFAACERGPTIDWSGPEDFFTVEKTEKNEDGSTRLEFHSLIDASPEGIYKALAEPENYAMFVEGVTESGILSTSGDSKTTYITQKVIGRQNRAKVKWTLYPKERKIDFETLESDLNYNDGSYQIMPSPDGKRAYVISIYNLRQRGGTQVPPGVAASGTREAFKAAAASVKKRALGETGG